MSPRARLSLLAAGLLLVAAAAACIAPTPYAPASGSGRGYREIRIEEDRFRVTFAGNSVTSRETVETYLLYRAAELTLALGYDHFVVTERSTAAETEYEAYGPPVYGYYAYGPRFPYHAYGYPWGYRVSYSTSTEYEATANIVMRRGPKPPGKESAFDAREVAQNLGPLVERPAED